ncbi:hypothetical protein CASFOL_033702 [Castilleja foliolosa]|uniref:RING-type E3 ubiquitin transferase n=1 Tax=Castilleja foliolosa TaxID=1961234 RepID=A0ABD3BYV8_9LAMI
MVMDVVLSSSSLGPLLNLVSETIEAIIEIVLASQNVLVDNKSFAQLSSYLERIVPLLHELNANNNRHITASEPLTNFLQTLSHETKEAQKLITDCSERNRFYLFVNCRSIAKRIERITREISRAISCIPFASLNISLTVKNDLGELVDKMQNAEFKAAVEKEEILDKIEIGINERNVDRAYANNLLVSIAKAIGIPTDRDALKKEFDEFRGEIENLSSRKDKAEAMQMEQIIGLLEQADAASSLEDREKKYLTKRKSLGTQPLEALTSFYCPITKEVMVDPVETPSGHTFERVAIEDWLASEGNGPFCPLTLEPLDVSMLRPNKTLRQSIEEWKERNTMIVVGSLRSRLLSGAEDDVVRSLEQIEGLCKEREIHKEWLILENYIPCLVDLFQDKNREVRSRALRVLCLLAKDNVDAKGRIANIENSISPIVQFLGRRIEERKLAVTLLLELSKCENMRERIGKAQGCIILLVTMLGNTDPQAAQDAKNVLDSLSYSDENVIHMAKSNYFEYLLRRLSSGSDHVKMTMAKTLGEMELTDHNKSSLVENGVLDLLLVLVPHDNVEVKIAAIEALLNLSSLRKNGQEILKKGAVRPLLDILYRQTSSQRLRELVANTIAHLAQSTVPEGSDSVPLLCMFESDDDISELFSFINLAGPALQQYILRAFRAMCLSPCAVVVKSKLRECSAVQILFQLYEVDDITLRANAINLLCCLTEDVDETTITEHITRTSIETLLKIINTSEDEDEIASSLGVIGNLPKTSQISDWLLESPNLHVIFNFLRNSQNSMHQKQHVVENAIGAVSRLTVEACVQLQKKVAEAEVIPFLVSSLEYGTDLTIKRASVSLTRLSRNSPRLSRQISRRNSGFWCFSALPDSACPVHRGLCTIQSSFCLIEANAIGPLIRVLGKQDPFVCEAGLDALLTLIDDVTLQNGCKVLDEENAMPAMIKLIGSNCVDLQEKVLNAFERIFRLVEYKHKYGKLAQAPLVDLTQRGNRSLRSLAAKLLGQLNVLHDQSSYF